MADLLDPQPGRGDEDQLASLLAHLMVSVERGIERIEMNHLAQILWKCDGDQKSCRRRNRNRTVATRDSWVQTSPQEAEDQKSAGSPKVPTDAQGASGTQHLAPLASEEEFFSDTESKLRRNADVGLDENCNPTEGSCSSCPSDAPEVIMFSDLPSVTELDPIILESKVAISPGSRDISGRNVVFLTLSQLRVYDCITAVQLARLLLSFKNMPSKKEAPQGFLMIINGKETAEKEWIVLKEALCIVDANSPQSYKMAIVWPKHNMNFHISSLFHDTKFQCEVITNENELLSYIKKSQLLPEFGGSYKYDHEEWIDFHKLLDPFTSGCRRTGGYLVRVMQELRGYHPNSSTSLTNQMIEHQKKQIMEALEDEQLRSLEENGDIILSQLESYYEKSPHNLGYKEAIQKSMLLYKQLKKVLQRLNKLADKRLSKLQECMLLKAFEEESSQILSWLCMKGEETLKKHKSLPDNFSAIKQQENEFEKFYFLAMRHIERGNDLLEELPKPKEVLSSGMDGMTTMLRNHLGDFSERLETAREKLEDTSRCYQLLDKCYEWALETMRFVSLMKVDSTTSLDGIIKIIGNLKEYLDHHPYIGDHIFEEMVSLAEKLNNDRLLQQCQTAKRKCQETMELVHARQGTLENAKDQMEDDVLPLAIRDDSPGSVKARSHIWMPVISSTPYRTPSQNYLHSHGPQFGSQYVFREPTGSYTSFPSSYYPATEFKDSRLVEHYNRRKGELNISSEHLSKDFVNQRPASLLSSLIDPVNSRVEGRRRSYASSSTSSLRSSTPSSSSSHEILQELRSVSRGVPSGVTPNEDNIRNQNNNGQKWKTFKDALEKATEEVREQNSRLLQEHLNERESDYEDVGNVPSSFSDSPRLSADKPMRPMLANAHLLRCTSCSDFEELLSPKNSEAEVAKAKVKKKLKMIMREMIQTERDYVKSLEYIIENYIPVLQKSDIPQVLRGQRNVIFGNIEKIYEFHNCYFLQELEQCETMPYSVGQCFLKYEPQFYLYALYNKNKPKSEALMAEYGNNFFRSKQQELGDKMDLASYLLKPVQRMGKYALLVKQLLKECPERDNDYNELKAAEEMIHFQLRHGNDLLAMDALRDCDVNVKEQGRLLRQDEFLVWQGKSRKALRHVFLFEDLILFSKARRDPERKGHDYYQYKHSIKTSDIGLTEQAGESPTKFEIWFRKWKLQDVHTLQAPSTETKKAWIQDISKLLWNQALRNRELRMAEMSSMGIGNKPCLDISPSQNQICDRSISLQQLNKAPRFRNSIAVINCEGTPSKRPYSIISVSSSSSSGSNQSSGTFHSPLNNLLEADENEISRCHSMTQQSQCSAESGFFTDVSMSGDSYAESEYQRLKSVERSDSILSRISVASSVGAVCSDVSEIKQDNQDVPSAS